MKEPQEGYSVQEQVFSPMHGGWIWAVVTTRPTREEAIEAATSYAAHREGIGVLPCGMRVMDLEDGTFVWDDLATLEDRRRALEARVLEQRREREEEAKRLAERETPQGTRQDPSPETVLFTKTPKRASEPMRWPSAVALSAFFLSVAYVIVGVWGG